VVLEVWLVELEQIAAALEGEERQRPRLDEDDLRHIGDVNHAQLRRQRRLATIALRVAIGAFTGNDSLARAPIVRLPGGKPVLPGLPVSFSISHAAGRALIALTSGAPVGVDIEPQRSLRMSPARQAALIEAARVLPLVPRASTLQTLPSDHEAPVQSDPVLSAWVRLEALAKLDGMGMARLLTHAGVLGRRNQSGGQSAETVAGAATPDWPGSFVETGTAIVDLAVPPDPSCDAWYAALAVPAALLRVQSVKVRTLSL